MPWMPPARRHRMSQAGDVSNHQKGESVQEESARSMWQSRSLRPTAGRPAVGRVPRAVAAHPVPFRSGTAADLHRGRGGLCDAALLRSQLRGRPQGLTHHKCPTARGPGARSDSTTSSVSGPPIGQGAATSRSTTGAAAPTSTCGWAAADRGNLPHLTSARPAGRAQRLRRRCLSSVVGRELRRSR
jgi:hypothetical protein